MEPENELLEEEIPRKKHHFSGSMLIFGGVNKTNDLPPIFQSHRIHVWYIYLHFP